MLVGHISHQIPCAACFAVEGFLTAFALLVLLSVHCYGLIVFIRKDKKINLTLLSCSFPHVEGKKLVFLIGAKRS